jgi:hypothetical protein
VCPEDAALLVAYEYPPGKDPFNAPWEYSYELPGRVNFAGDPLRQTTDIHGYRGEKEGWSHAFGWRPALDQHPARVADEGIQQYAGRDYSKPSLCCCGR